MATSPIGIPASGRAARGLARRRSWLTAGLSVLFVLSWSSGFIGAKLGAGEASTPTVLMWRFLPLALVLLPLALRRAGRGLRGVPRAELRRHVLIGLLSQSGYLLAVYGAIGLGVSTGTTALVDGIQPLVAAVLVGPLLGLVVGRRAWLALGLGLSGVVLVTWTDATAPTSTAPAWAYLVPLAGMLALVWSTVLERRAAVRTPPLTALAVHCATSAVVFTGLALATGGLVPPSTGGFWFATAWLVVLPTFGGYGLYWLLVERVGVTAVNGLLFLIAPVTSLWGAALFGEPLTAVTVAGLALAAGAALGLGRTTGARPSIRGASPRTPHPGTDPGTTTGAGSISGARRSLVLRSARGRPRP